MERSSSPAGIGDWNFIVGNKKKSKTDKWFSKWWLSCGIPLELNSSYNSLRVDYSLAIAKAYMNNKELLDSLKCLKISAPKIRIPFLSLELDPHKPAFFEAQVGEPYSSGVRKNKVERECKQVLEEYISTRLVKLQW